MTGECLPLSSNFNAAHAGVGVCRNNNRQAEIKELTAKGILPIEHDLKEHPEKSLEARAWLIGRVAALIHEVLPAKQIVDSMVNDAAQIMQTNAARLSVKAKL